MARRRSTLNESSIAEIVSELNKANYQQELIHDAITAFNPVLKSPIVYDVIDNSQTFLALVAQCISDIDENVSKIFADITGNKLQEEENRREMIAVLEKIAEGGTGGGGRQEPPPLPKPAQEDSPVKTGIFAGIAAFVSNNLAKFIPAQLKGMFASIGAVFANIMKFGKVLVRFAGPIAIVVAAITGLYGAIKGGIEGYENGGIEGAIKGAIIGGVDMLVGTLVKGLANGAGWLLDALGFDKIGAMLGPGVEKIFDNIYSMLSGVVDIFTGLFTLDADKVIEGIKTVVTSLIDGFMIFGELFVTFASELLPKLWEAIKFTLWELPKLIGELLAKAFYWIAENAPGFIDQLSVFVGELWAKAKEDLWPWIAEKVNGFMDVIFEALTGIFDGAGDKVAGAWNSWVEYRDEMYKKILREILPPRDSAKPWFDPMSLISRAIPDEVYDFAGMPSGDGLNDATGGVNPFEKKAKAMQAGYETWDEYKASGWKWKGPEMQPAPSSAGQTLAESTNAMSNAPVIINQMGGNVTNTTMSSVNNNTTPFEPILTGSALGFVSM